MKIKLYLIPKIHDRFASVSPCGRDHHIKSLLEESIKRSKQGAHTHPATGVSFPHR